MIDGPIALAPDDLAGDLGEALLRLNNDHEVELSRLSGERLRALVAEAFVAWRIGEADALLIAFDQAAAYDGLNFHWFRDRFERFVYVDRVVVSARARGRGHARRLYRDLFARARAGGHDRIVCEVNSTPPNPESDAFHASLGFAEVGAGPIPGGKSVRYLLRRLDDTGVAGA
jgi:predicted GNAT superfamily acetyltransferase